MSPCALEELLLAPDFCTDQYVLLLQLAEANHIEDVFSLCFGGVEGNGALMLGDVPPASFNVTLQYTPLISSPAHPHYYLAKLNDISVNATTLPVSQVCCVTVHQHNLLRITAHGTFAWTL